VFLRELRELERQIRLQRSKVARDQERVRRVVSDVPRDLLRKLGSREGLIVSFSVGAAAAAFAPGRGVLSVALLDMLTRLAIAELPHVSDVIREHYRDREPADEPAS
jgi:hypothetical protein